MAGETTIAWRRVIAEGIAIVGSILLAFGIQAWWEERGDLATERGHLLSLAAEIEQNEQLLEEAQRDYESRYTEADLLLRALNGSVDPNSDSVQLALGGLFSNKTVHLELGAFEALVGSGGLGLIQDEQLRLELASLPSYVDEWTEETEAVYRFVLDTLIPALRTRARLPIPFPQFPDGEAPPRLTQDPRDLVTLHDFGSSVELENLLTERANGAWLAMRDGETLLARLREIRLLINQSLED